VSGAPAPAPSRGALLAGLVVLAAAVWAFHAWWTIARFDQARFTYDSAQYALAARELAETGRLLTPYSYVGPLRAASGPPWPLLAGHPLVPLLQAPVFAVFGAGPWSSLVPVVFAHLLAVLLGALLVLELGGGLLLAGAVGVALAGSPMMLAFATDGLSEMPFTAAWTAAMLVLARTARTRPAAVGTRDPGSGRGRWPLVLGALLGLAHLARPVVAPTLPLWLAGAAWAAPPGRRLRTAAAVAAAFAPLAGAWLLYKQVTLGQPFFEVGNIMLLTGLAPGFGEYDVARLLHPPDAVAWIAAHPEAFAAKLATNVPAMGLAALRLGGWALGLAFAWAVLQPARDGRGPLRLVAGGSLALLAALCALTLVRPHYLFPMLPTTLAMGAVALERTLRRSRLPALTAGALVVAALLWSSWRPLARDWARARNDARPAGFTGREVAALGAAIARRLPAGTIIASDMAPWISWYARRASVNLPFAIADLAELRDRHGVQAVVVTNHWLVARQGNEAWRDVHLERVTPAGWAPAGVVTSGRLHARVLVAAGAAARLSSPPASPPR
jgi:4-amino-4-deoxy-L-arabinose transferase-like glycosyltransferase